MTKMGRPQFEPTDLQRQQVSEMAFVGMIQREIALVLGLSTPTLRRAFRSELRSGSLQKRAELVAKLCELGLTKGNVQALKKLDEMARASEAGAARAAAVAPVGKKAAANARAKAVAASGRFNAMPAPRLAVVGGTHHNSGGGDDAA